MGGLSRRATIVDSLSQPLFVFEAGNWGWKSSLLPKAKREQQQRKASLQLDAMKLSFIDAVGIGTGDLALGLPFLSKQTAPLVLSNLKCSSMNSWNDVRTFSRGGISVGFASVLSSTSKVPDGCTLQPPHEAMETIAQQHHVDLWVLSAELSQEESRSVSTVLPRVLFVDTKSRRMRKVPEKIGSDAVVLSAGSRGKYVGEVSVHIPKLASGVRILGQKASQDKERKRFQDRIDKAQKEIGTTTEVRQKKRLERQVEYYTKKISQMPVQETSELSNPWIVANTLHGLGASIENHPKTEALVVLYKEIEEKRNANKKGIYNGPFVGSKSCKGCHPYQYEHWEGTAHAKAWKTLIDEQRSQDQACFSCHVTGAHHPQGPASPSEVNGLEAVGCESCHGPGKEHVQSSGQADMIKEPELSTCTQCHDGIKDEGRFEPTVYYSKIRHPSLQKEDEQ